MEWGRLIGLVEGALPVAGDVQAGFRLVIKAPAILFYQSPLTVSLLQGDLLGRGVVVDFGIVAESWSVFVHGRSRRADKFG